MEKVCQVTIVHKEKVNVKKKKKNWIKKIFQTYLC